LGTGSKVTSASIDKHSLRAGLHVDGLYAESLKYRDLSEM